MNIFILSKNEKIKEVIERDNRNVVVDYTSNRNEAANRIFSLPTRVDVLFATEDLNGRGNTISTLIDIKKANPLLKIIYINNTIDDVTSKFAIQIEGLINNRIYDIYITKHITGAIINEMIQTDKDVKYAKGLLPERNNNIIFDEEINIAKTSQNQSKEIPALQNIRNNIYVFSSIKPGSGKSFISSNVAVAIALDGIKKETNNQKPKVLLIEADLQTLSIANLFGVDNRSNNLKNVLTNISRIITPEGDIKGDDEYIQKMNDYISSKCIQIPSIPNLYLLTGTSLSLEDIQTVSPYQYFYLLDTVSKMFDIVIVDANSSLEHKTTGPILQLAKQCFLILNPDYNSLKISKRYQKDLSEINMTAKIRYILNKNYTTYQKQVFASNLNMNLDKELASLDVLVKVPEIDPTIAYNCIYNHSPVYLDTTTGTLQARVEIAKIANYIYPVNVYNKVNKEIEQLRAELGIKKKNKRKGV